MPNLLWKVKPWQKQIGWLRRFWYWARTKTETEVEEGIKFAKKRLLTFNPSIAIHDSINEVAANGNDIQDHFTLENHVTATETGWTHYKDLKHWVDRENGLWHQQQYN